MISSCKVSVIVPIYNVEKYLARCLESLINQTLKDIEIVCVNDGSTDDSLNILNKYAKKDTRIKIINKVNGGLSSARNAALDIVNGEYVSFVDSDDWVDINMLKDMYENAIKEKYDIVMCSYTREYINKSRLKKLNMQEVAIYGEDEVSLQLHRRIIGPLKEELANPEQTDSLVTAWGKLYKTEIINNNNIRFIDTSIIGTEDCLFNVYAFKYIKKAMFLNKPYYHYWKENPSSLTSIHKQNLKDKWMNMYNYIRDFLDENKYDEIFYEALNNRICMSIIGLGLNECYMRNTSELEKIKNIKKILSDEVIINALSKLELRYLPIHWKIFYIFNKNKMAISSYIMINMMEFLRKRIK